MLEPHINNNNSALVSRGSIFRPQTKEESFERTTSGTENRDNLWYIFSKKPRHKNE